MALKVLRYKIRTGPLAIAGGALLFLLCAFHLTFNKRGVLKWRALRTQAESLLEELENAKGERLAMEKRVSLLRDDSLDLDLLDEKARQMLDLSSPDEIIVPVKDEG